MPKDLELFAVELRKKFSGPYGCNWGMLAKHVSSLLLEARIEEHQICCTTCICNAQMGESEICTRLAQLQKQKDGL